MIKPKTVAEEFIQQLQLSPAMFYEDIHSMMGHNTEPKQSPFNRGVFYCMNDVVTWGAVKTIIENNSDKIYRVDKETDECFTEADIEVRDCLEIKLIDGFHDIVIFFVNDPEICWGVSQKIDASFESIDEYLEVYDDVKDLEIAKKDHFFNKSTA